MSIESYGGMIVTEKNRRTRRNSCPIATFPRQIPHGLTQASAVRVPILTTWAIARPPFNLVFPLLKWLWRKENASQIFWSTGWQTRGLFVTQRHLYPIAQGFSTGVPRDPRVPRDVARGSARDRDWKNKHSFLNLLAKINRSTENIILYSKDHRQLLLDYYVYNLLITLTYREL
jgi:hypothetical protein